MHALQPLASRCECATHAAHAPRHHAAPPPRAPLRLAPRRRARQRAFAPCAALPESLALIADAAAASAYTAASAAPAQPPPHVFEPPVVEPWQLWVGFVAGMAPFVIAGALTPQRTGATIPCAPPAPHADRADACFAARAAYEFGKRILIQRECARCGGSGLIQRTLPIGVTAEPGMQPLRKCTSCGGFLPWLSWKYFFTSAATPGNGGALRAPRGQSSVFYDVAAATRASEADAAAAALMRDAAARREDEDAPR
jgi:hypothetical protein